MQPLTGDVEYQRTLGAGIALALARVEEQDLGVAESKHDGRVFLRVQLFLRGEVGQDEAAESAFEYSKHPPHPTKDTLVGKPAGALCR
jgi:hypothetical protein